MPIESTIGRCDIPSAAMISADNPSVDSVLYIIHCLFIMSVGTTALSHLKLASNRTCHEICCAEGLPVTLEGHGYHDFTDCACYRCM